MSSVATLPRSSLLDLSAHATRTAVWTPAGALGYDDLADRAGRFAEEVLGTTRRLVLIEGANHLDALTAYLAAVEHGHVALLVPDRHTGQREALVDAYDPDVVVTRDADGWRAVPRRDGSAHRLHPDLALLLSTSGTTGSPKLVRLSGDNLRSNAESIASYLRLTPEDRAATSLPMHYCYGLSVVNSHLATGAGLVLTEGSVVDECFWRDFTEGGATSFAGVPYTFELLDRSGFAERRVPGLRYVTQAGGRLEPERVRRYAELGRRRGWEFVVMYGQTEATARMAYLPPALAAERPEAIGVPVPGGSFRIEPVAECVEPGTGELVYRGPNVMMGYAEDPADLALGACVEELRTGDLARRRDGLYEIVGRRGRRAKLFGLRLDLDHVERLASTDRPVHCVALDHRLHLFVAGRPGRDLARTVAELCGLPATAVGVTGLDRMPLTPNGKVDYAALTRRAGQLSDPQATLLGAPTTTQLCEEFALVLDRADVRPESTFVALGGDSLSYVELATRLSHCLGDLPADWHTRSVAELAAQGRSQRPGTTVDSTLLLRALAIVAIVGSHANLLTLVGGAHVLLVVAGYNFARFHLADVPRRLRVRNALAATAQVAVPSALFIGVVAATTGFYEPATALFLNGLLGSDGWTVQWQFWFLEALVWLSLGTCALVASARVDRWERRAPFAFAAGLLAATLAVRYLWTGVTAGPTERYTIGLVAWCFALGWIAARARTPGQRMVVAAVAALALAGFFADTQRELLVWAGVVVLLWLPTVRVPRLVARLCGLLAGSSLYVYLTHWQVYPHLEVDHPLPATLASFAVGLAYGWLMRPVARALRARTAPLRAAAGPSRSAAPGWCPRRSG